MLFHLNLGRAYSKTQKSGRKAGSVVEMIYHDHLSAILRIGLI